MNEQRAKRAYWSLTAIALAGVYMMIRAARPDLSGGANFIILLVCAGLVSWVYWRDKMRKLTVLFFEPDEDTRDFFDNLSGAFRRATKVAKVRAVAQTSTYSDTKYSGGASKGLKFTKASLKLGQAPGVASNIDVPLLATEKTTLAFFPDRILAFQGDAVGAIDYKDFQAYSTSTQFIEHESVPSDATVVGKTWEYVNKSGGPDKRFKDNKQMPVCEYNKLQLRTENGLDIQFMGSKTGAFDHFAAALSEARKN